MKEKKKDASLLLFMALHYGSCSVEFELRVLGQYTTKQIGKISGSFCEKDVGYLLVCTMEYVLRRR